MRVIEPSAFGSTGRGLDIGVFGARGIPSTYGGYETFLTVLLPELVRRGHSVTCYGRRGDVPDLDSYRGVRCVQVAGVRSKQLSTIVHGWAAAAQTWAARHDVVLVLNVANAAACVMSRVAGERIVLNVDGLEWDRSKWSRLGRSVFLGSAHLSRWAANALIADSRTMREVYATRFGGSPTQIPYCWSEITPSPPGALARWDLEPRRYCLVAARLVPENNVDTIAAAYLASDLDLPLVVLGTANYASPVVTRLNALAQQHPRLLLAGHIEDRALFACLLANATAYIHGHSVGGINPSLIEAMGCGARVLALDTPFNREALDDVGDYFSRPAELISGVEQIVHEPDAARAWRRESARSRAAARFSLDSVADAYESLLLDVAAHGRWSRSKLTTRWESEILAPA